MHRDISVADTYREHSRTYILSSHSFLPSSASFSLSSLLRFTSQLYTRAVFTSMTVICSWRNSRSSTTVFKDASAASSFERSSAMASGSLYESITFA